LLYSHLSWHLALGDLAAGDAAAAFRLFREAFSPDVHSGPPGGKVNDAVSFLWRWELAGHPRDAEAWRMIHDFANSAFPRAGVAFSDMHIALAHARTHGGQRRLCCSARCSRRGSRPLRHRVPTTGRSCVCSFLTNSCLRRCCMKLCCTNSAFQGCTDDVASSNYPVFKGPATLYLLRMMPDGIAFVLTSSNERAGVPSAKKRFPVPNRTG